MINNSRRSVVPLHEQFIYRVDYVGRDRQPVLIVDQFLAQAETLVDFAERNAVFSVADARYPGVRAPAPMLYIESFHAHLHDLVRDTFGLCDEWVTGIKADFSMVVTRPEYLIKSQVIPHFDSTNGRELAAVHYLCDEAMGGTSLYRHISTGYETISAEVLPDYQYALDQDCIKYPAARSYMNGSNALFEQTVSYDAAFNRLIMYPCNLLHSGNIAPDFAFDPNPRSGRLTLNTFIYARAD